MTDTGLTFHCQPPAALSPEQLARTGQFIETHGGVPPRWIRHNLERAFLIAWAERAGTIVGSSCLKRPRPEYLEKLSERMEIALEGFLERGYTCVHSEWTGQGIASRLIGMLAEQAGDRPYYALVHENNPAIQKILSRSGQVKVNVFYSDLAKRELGLWISPHAARLQGLDQT